jgi:hypothetical protein
MKLSIIDFRNRQLDSLLQKQGYQVVSLVFPKVGQPLSRDIKASLALFFTRPYSVITQVDICVEANEWVSKTEAKENILHLYTLITELAKSKQYSLPNCQLFIYDGKENLLQQQDKIERLEL